MQVGGAEMETLEFAWDGRPPSEWLEKQWHHWLRRRSFPEVVECREWWPHGYGRPDGCWEGGFMPAGARLVWEYLGPVDPPAGVAKMSQ